MLKPCDIDQLLTQDLANGFVVFFINGKHNKNQFSINIAEITNPKQPKIHEGFLDYNTNSFIIAQKQLQITNTNFFSNKHILAPIYAVLYVLEYALAQKYDQIALYCNLIGLIKWAKKEWNANLALTQFYQQKYDQAAQKIKIHWQKIPLKHHNQYLQLASKNNQKTRPNILVKKTNHFQNNPNLIHVNKQIMQDLAAHFKLFFCDGAYVKNNNYFGVGIIEVLNQKQHKIHQGFFNAQKKHWTINQTQLLIQDVFLQSNNIFSEIYAALYVFEYALRCKYKQIAIYCDLIGLIKWAKKEWRTNLALTRFYQQKYDQAAQKMQILFRKVKAHSQIYYNELADQAAKQALLEGMKKTGLFKNNRRSCSDNYRKN